jgi:hypothetical protein
MALPVLDHMPANVRIRRLIDLRAISLWLHSADLLQCPTNECHNFRPFLLLRHACRFIQNSDGSGWCRL